MKKNYSFVLPDWYCNDISQDQRWLRYLSVDDKSLISTYMNKPDSLTLPKLHYLFEEIFSGIINQCGFLIVRGFPIPNDEYSLESIRHFFLEFCSFLGEPLIQNKKQDYLFDIQVHEFADNDPNARGPQINDVLPLHADHGGLLGMYCLQEAEVGGNTLLASTYTVHNEIEKESPDLLDVLYQPFYGDRRGQEPEGELPYDFNPIFAIKNNKLLCQYAGYYLDDTSEKFPNLPPLTQQQKEAIELFCEISSRKDIQFEVKLKAGDIIFINNNRVLHGRTAFAKQSKRHLLRIWLSTPRIPAFPHYYGYPMPF